MFRDRARLTTLPATCQHSSLSSSAVQRVTVSSGSVVAVVSPADGSRLASLSFDGTEMLINRARSTLEWGCYPMVPYAGRVRDAKLMFGGRIHDLLPNGGRHSLHGTVFDVPWEIVDASPSTATFTTTLGDDWPFAATVVHRVETDNHGITMRLVVHADEPQPVQVGWHPWFVKPESTRFGFTEMLARDSDGIAVSLPVAAGDPPYDDCFVGNATTPEIEIGGVQLRVASDCSHWVVYDEPTHATCIEPQSGPPNSVNDNPDVLSAGEILSRWFRIERC
jgi:aldose 1-epimerase